MLHNSAQTGDPFGTSMPNDATTPAHGHHGPPPVQLALFGADDATRQTRAIAAATAIATGPSRRDRLARWIADRGHLGATREEIATALRMKIQSVCPLVKEMQRAGRLVPTHRTRPTTSGKPAVVLIAPSFTTPATPRS